MIKKIFGYTLLNISLLILALILIAGCFHFVSNYDSITYKNLTDLKGEMKIYFEVYEVNGANKTDLPQMTKFVISLSKATEYEKGKSKNDDTLKQFLVIDKIMNGMIDRLKSGKDLSPSYCKLKWKFLSKAFDIAIKTERIKIQKE